MQSACAELSFVVCPAMQYFPTLSHKRHNFRKRKIIEYKMCFDFLNKIFPKISHYKNNSAVYYHKVTLVFT